MATKAIATPEKKKPVKRAIKKAARKIPENLIPLIYLIAVAVIGGALHKIGVPPEMNGLIVGAGITRVKVAAGG